MSNFYSRPGKAGGLPILIKLDYSSKEETNVVAKTVEISDRYEIGDIPKLPQILIDHYRSYLDELLGDPEFIALSETLRDANDAEIAGKAAVEAYAKKLGYPSTEAYYEAARRQSHKNFLNNIFDIQDAIPFQKGDVFNLPGLFYTAVDRFDEYDSIIYLVRQLSGIGIAFYVKTNRELSFFTNYAIREPMVLKYIGPAEYIQGRVQRVDSWLFEKIN
jgi:hypothetical protein